VARDATTRLYDVDADSIVLDKKTGTVTFKAKKGKLVDLDKLHESIWATRLGDGTGMELKVLDVTAEGEVVVVEKQTRLKVAGSDQYFVLVNNPNSRDESEQSTLARLQKALAAGEKVVSVTGRVEGWNGNFTQFLKKLPGKPRTIVVKDFQTAKP